MMNLAEMWVKKSLNNKTWAQLGILNKSLKLNIFIEKQNINDLTGRLQRFVDAITTGSSSSPLPQQTESMAAWERGKSKPTKLASKTHDNSMPSFQFNVSMISGKNGYSLNFLLS